MAPHEIVAYALVIGIGERLAPSPSHTTVRTVRVYGGSISCAGDLRRRKVDRASRDTRSTVLGAKPRCYWRATDRSDCQQAAQPDLGQRPAAPTPPAACGWFSTATRRRVEH